MKTKIQNLITDARRDGNKTNLATYQGILSAIQEKEARNNITLNDDQIVKVIEAERALYEEGIAKVIDKNPTLAEDYKIQSKLCEDILPELPDPVDESKYDDIVSEAIASTGATSIRDMGSVMGNIKQEYGKSVDNSKISSLVKEQLQTLSS